MIKTRKLCLGALALLLGSFGASAQTDYVLTFQGTVGNDTNAYANSGDAFSGTFTLNSPVDIGGAPGTTYQATISGPADDSFLDSTTTGIHLTTTGESGTAPDTGATVTILSDYAGYGHPPTPIYGYQFVSDDDLAPSSYQPGYEFWQLTVVLESTNSFVAPTGTLADLGNFDIGDFNTTTFTLTLEQASYNGMTFTGYVPAAYEGGTITSYNIQKTATATPEPATWMLLVAGLVAIGGWSRGRDVIGRH